MKLLDKMRQQKLLSTTLMLFTLSIGIVIGTLVNTGVNAARAQNIAPDATPLVVPQAVETGNEFSKLAKKISPSVVNITADYTPKMQTTRNRRGVRPAQPNEGEEGAEDQSSDLFRRFFGGGDQAIRAGVGVGNRLGPSLGTGVRLPIAPQKWRTNKCANEPAGCLSQGSRR